MKFSEWVEQERGEQSRTAFLRDFSAKVGVSYQTLSMASKGARLALYPKAKAVSDGTLGQVTVEELCAVQ